MHTRERQRESTNASTEESRQFFNIVQAMDETEREQVLKVGEILCSIEKLTKENFHLSDKEFAEIMNGTSKVYGDRKTNGQYIGSRPPELSRRGAAFERVRTLPVRPRTKQ